MHSFATLNKDIPCLYLPKYIYSAVITFAVTFLIVIFVAVIFLAVIPFAVDWLAVIFLAVIWLAVISISLILLAWHFLRCCYIKVDLATTALQNGTCTYRCISKHPFHTTAIWKVWNFIINPVLFGKKHFFDRLIFTQNYAWHITQSGWNNYSV